MIYNLRILFIGTVEFSYKSFEKLIQEGFEIVGLVTKKKSDFNSDFKDLSILAKKNNIPICFKNKNNEDELINFIKKTNPNIIYCFGWSHILSSNFLSKVNCKVIGFHPTELPNNRGRHPITWALFLDLKKTSSTFFLINEGIDSGEIISQKEIIISRNDNAFSLYKKITNIALNQILSFTNSITKSKGKIQIIKGNNADGNYWRKRNKFDGLIDFRMSSKAIYNLVRSLSYPYVGAHVIYNNNEVKIWKIKEEKCNLNNIEPGKIIKIKKERILVKCYEDAVWLLEHDFLKMPKINEYL